MNLEFNEGLNNPKIGRIDQITVRWGVFAGRCRRDREVNKKTRLCQLDQTPPMSTPTSTRAKPSKPLIWLFFDPTWNADGILHHTQVSGYALDSTPVEGLEWVGDLKKRFRFKVDESTLRFWKVGYRPTVRLPPRC